MCVCLAVKNQKEFGINVRKVKVKRVSVRSICWYQ